MVEIIVAVVIGTIVLMIFAAIFAPDDKKTDGYGFTAADRALHGTANAQMVCPHCQTKGKVLSKPISKKAGISGGKATGALLTGGISLLATGLSRKENFTEAYCKKCKSTWHF